MQHSRTGQLGLPNRSQLDSGKGFMAVALTVCGNLRQPDGSAMAPIRRPGQPAQKSGRNPNFCGKKDTDSLPQCRTGI
jgi:hypothetical protein